MVMNFLYILKSTMWLDSVINFYSIIIITHIYITRWLKQGAGHARTSSTFLLRVLGTSIIIIILRD